MTEPEKACSASGEEKKEKEKHSVDKEEYQDTRKFFRRLSAIKAEYERNSKRTVSRYESTVRASTATFLREREEIIALLWSTLYGEDLNFLFHELDTALFPTSQERERTDAKPLIKFLEALFTMGGEKPMTSRASIREIQSTKPAKPVLYVEVVEARNLPDMDSNGLSDPFCTIYVTSKENSKRTKVKEKTLNPQWNETFKFKLQEPEKDYICLEIWDYDPQERMRDKFKRVKDIASVKGVGNFMKDLTHGRHSSQEFMGRISIPMKEVSAEVRERWWPLGSTSASGEVYLKLGLGIEKDRSEAIDMYRCVLQLILIQELTKPPVLVPFQWEHISDVWGEYLVRQLQTVWGLGSKDVLLAKWVAYVRIHSVFPLNGIIFPPMIHQVFQAAQTSEFKANDITMMLETVKKFIQFSCNFVEKIHDFFPCSVTTSNLYYILKCLVLLERLVDELKFSCDSRLFLRTDLSSTYIRTEIQNAIRRAARVKTAKLLEAMNESKPEPDETVGCEKNEALIKAKKLLNFGNLVIDDIEKGMQSVDKDFKAILKVDYHEITYIVFDAELAKIMSPFLPEFCSALKVGCDGSDATLELNDSKTRRNNERALAHTFLHLYLCIKKFSEIPCGPEEQMQKLRTKGVFHTWFSPGISHLVELFTRMWTGWMDKAVALDFQHDPEDSTNIYPYPKQVSATVSSSANDCVEIFDNIQVFWKHLQWPVPTESFALAKQLLQELCGFSIYFGNLTIEQVQAQERNKHGPFNLTARICRAVNNVNFVGEYTKDIAVHLNLQQLLLDIQSDSTTDAFFMNKQEEILEAGLNGIKEHLFIFAASKMEATLAKGLRELLAGRGRNREEELFQYLNHNLTVMDDHLLPSLFLPFLATIWEQCLGILKNITLTRIKEEKGWVNFLPVQDLLTNLKTYFEGAALHHVGKGCGLTGAACLATSGIYKELCKMLEDLSSSVASVKSKYIKFRFEDEEGKGSRGYLTVRILYQRDREILRVEVMNASKLLAADKNGLSDPFVQIQLVPEEHFPKALTYSTKVVKESLDVLFDEEFDIPLSKELSTNPECFIRLAVYDHDFLKWDEFLGEAYVPFHELPGSSYKVEPKRLPLSLSGPSLQAIEVLKGLTKNRTEKELKKFLESEKLKVALPSGN